MQRIAVPRRRRAAAAGAAALVAGVLTLTAPPSAPAHFEVKSTKPGKGGTARTSLRAVKVTFTGPIRSGTLRVRGPGRRLVSKNSGGRDPRSVARLRVRLKRGLSSGRYKARWTAVAADGHELSGSFRFRLRRP